MRLTLYVLLLFFCYGYGQDTQGNKIFTSLVNYYMNTNTYGIDYSYALYKRIDNTDVLSEKYNISIFKDGNRTRMDALDASMYTFSKDSLLISVFNKEKEIVIRNTNVAGDLNGVSQLNNFKQNYYITLEEENSKEQKLRLVPKPDYNSQALYSLIDITLDKQKHQIKSERLLLKGAHSYRTSTGSLGSYQLFLEILFTHKNLKRAVSLPNIDYFVHKGSTGAYQVSSNYQGYRIIDKRKTPGN